MMIPEIVRIGHAALEGAARRVFARGWLDVGEDEDETEPYGQVAMAGSLGVTSMPADPDDNGESARGLMMRGISGTIGLIAAAWDSRSSDIVGLLDKGDTCLHSTGSGFGSRLFMKNGAVELIVTGDNNNEPATIITLNQAEGSLQVFFGGHALEMTSGPSGKLRYDHPSGQSGVTIDAGRIHLRGKVDVGDAPSLPISTGASPAVVTNSSIRITPTPPV